MQVLLDSNLIICSVGTLGFQRLRSVDRFELERFFSTCSLLPVDRTIINHAAALRQQRKFSLGDAIIAATAITNSLTLATRNAADFVDVPSLQVVDPFNA
jgi:toxin FitB